MTTLKIVLVAAGVCMVLSGGGLWRSAARAFASMSTETATNLGAYRAGTHVVAYVTVPNEDTGKTLARWDTTLIASHTCSILAD